MSIIAASPSDSLKGFSRIIGVFPFVGGPLRQAQDQSRIALNKEIQKTNYRRRCFALSCRKSRCH